MSSSGAQRKIEGMKSIVVWVIARLAIKQARATGLIDNADEATIVETRLMCSPGDRPVITPMIIPRRVARDISRITIYSGTIEAVLKFLIFANFLTSLILTCEIFFSRL